MNAQLNSQTLEKRFSKQAPGNKRGHLPKAAVVRKILVTTDFSEASKSALRYAATLADLLGSRVALLNVLEPLPRLAGLESTVLLPSGDALIGRSLELLEAIRGQAFDNELRVETHVRPGKAHRAIVKAAEELDADLILMATHGKTGLKHTLLGSTTERVIRESPCSVLAVRTGEAKSETNIKRILFATDFSEVSLEALPTVRMFAARCRSSVTLLHVVERYPIDALGAEDTTMKIVKDLTDGAKARLEGIANELRREKVRADVVVRFGAPYAEVVTTAKELNASLVVVGTHGYRGLRRAYLGSVAERVVRHAHCPVLVVRGGRK